MTKEITDTYHRFEVENEDERFTVHLVTKENKITSSETYNDVDEFGIYECGSAVIITLRHGYHIEYFRLKYLVKWSLIFKKEN